tara:strand:- start:167 stop:373 length:207 start_codon:yes stop_codon:yes gene_type:complete
MKTEINNFICGSCGENCNKYKFDESRDIDCCNNCQNYFKKIDVKENLKNALIDSDINKDFIKNNIIIM